MKLLKELTLVISIVLFIGPSMSFADSETIAQLTKDIAQSTSETEKSKLLMYRARNHKKMGNLIQAELDYDAALAYDHKGWIHLERGRFFLANGNHVQARKEALAAKKETPTLAAEAEKILKITKIKEKKEREEQQPKEILLTKRWDVNYSKSPSSGSARKSNVRFTYAQRNKQRAKSRPRKVARS